nr:MAG TPA: hypothetical protein [Caudoviricetes sp.]DAL78676.1 MAG TPA: hypothetical protein [Caudoviricetes sp.]DAO52519.1 MAG TPA: hypothetical protein [Caudoviricetes sp.]
MILATSMQICCPCSIRSESSTSSSSKSTRR